MSRYTWQNLPHTIVHEGNIDVIKYLIKNQLDLNEKNSNGWTALHIASQHDNDKVIELLLAQGANTEVPCSRVNMTALHYAAEIGWKKAVKCLLARGANVHAKDRHGRTPLRVSTQHQGVMELLLENGANINAVDCCYRTTLHYAAYCGREKTVKFLIEKGANIRMLDMFGYSPLESAVKSEFSEDCRWCIRYLIQTIILRQHDATQPPDYLNKHQRKFWSECQRQVVDMQSTLLGSNKLSVYQFLRETDEKKLTGYVSDDGIRKALEKAQEDTFADRIEDQLNKGQEKFRVSRNFGYGTFFTRRNQTQYGLINTNLENFKNLCNDLELMI